MLLLANSESQTLMNALTDRNVFGWILTGAAIIIVVAIRTTAQVIRSTSRERTRREIAAFIAEGSMTPEQGERLMKAGGKEA